VAPLLVGMLVVISYLTTGLVIAHPKQSCRDNLHEALVLAEVGRLFAFRRQRIW
jgi:hypothetical protein